MGRRAILTEQIVMNVIHSTGRFEINPLSTRNCFRVRLLENMRKKGMVKRDVMKPDRHVYVRKVWPSTWSPPL